VAENAKCWCDYPAVTWSFEVGVGVEYVTATLPVFLRREKGSMRKKVRDIEVRFCPMCGKELEIRCPTCGQPYDKPAPEVS